MRQSFMLATPDDTRRAWVVTVGDIAREVYLSNDPAPGSFAGKMQEARELHRSGEVVVFPR